jgi:hypothetical protein
MSANLKGLGGIKGLALRHGEKIVIAIFGALAAWFVWSSLSLPRLEENLQATKIQGMISQTNTAITESGWPTADSEAIADVREYKPIAKHANVAVDPKKYEFKGFDPPVMAATMRRGDPAVLTAVDVKAYGQSGLLSFRDQDTAAEQQRLQKLKEEEQLKKQERLAAENAAGSEAEGGRNNRRGPEGELDTAMFDPEHPNRRMIEGTGTPAGVPLQGGERLERVYWTTVVAKVPIREQLDLFQETFRNARGYDAARDFPQYVGYQVQRSEVVGGKQSDWKLVYVYDGQAKYIPSKPAGKAVNMETVTELNRLAGLEWAGPALEPVDARWTDMVLTLPLPPLVGRNFGAEATHPDIPLAVDAPPPEVETAPAEGPVQQPVEGEDDGAFSAGTAGQQPAGGEFAMQGQSMRGGAGPEGGMRPGLGMRGMIGPEGEFGGRGGMGPGGGVASAGGISSGQRTVLPREVDDLLLRFFDYTVEPGKEYQYRVRVFLADPNYSFALSSGVLDGAVIDRRTKEKKQAGNKPVPWFRAAAWSEPSSVVGVPIGGTVHIAEAIPLSGKSANDEPAIKIFAETFDIEPTDKSAIHVAHETEIRRGAVINLNGKMRYTGDNDRWIDTKDSYALNTGITVLDVDGGKEIAKKKTTPSRVLMMDGAGQLFVRDELADTPNVQYLRYVFSDDKKPKKGGEFAPGMRGRGGER